MFRRSPRRGLTRLEVFVVIAGVCILLALTLPAIQTSRETARRTQCGNSLKLISLALQTYHATHMVFPMGAMHSGPNPGGDPPVTAGLGPSWWFGLLPLMDQRRGARVVVSRGPKSIGNYVIDADGPMYDKIVESQRPGHDVRCEFCADDVARYLTAHPYTVSDGRDVGRLSIWSIFPEYMRCPSCPLPVQETVIGPITLPSYVGIAGGCDIDPKSQDYKVNDDAPSGLVAPKAERIYHNRYKGTGAAAGAIRDDGLSPPVP